MTRVTGQVTKLSESSTALLETSPRGLFMRNGIRDYRRCIRFRSTTHFQIDFSVNFLACLRWDVGGKSGNLFAQTHEMLLLSWCNIVDSGKRKSQNHKWREKKNPRFLEPVVEPCNSQSKHKETIIIHIKFLPITLYRNHGQKQQKENRTANETQNSLFHIILLVTHVRFLYPLLKPNNASHYKRIARIVNQHN